VCLIDFEIFCLLHTAVCNRSVLGIFSTVGIEGCIDEIHHLLKLQVDGQAPAPFSLRAKCGMVECYRETCFIVGQGVPTYDNVESQWAWKLWSYLASLLYCWLPEQFFAVSSLLRDQLNWCTDLAN